jgi:hypothetical protein
MHPTDPDVLLAGCGNNSASFYKDGAKSVALGGAFLTTNGGRTWVKTLAGETITAVEFSPSHPEDRVRGRTAPLLSQPGRRRSWAVMAGSESQGWGPPGVGAGFPIDILVDPRNPDVLFVNNYGGGNVKSENGAGPGPWPAGGTGALMFDVDADASQPDTVYAGARSGAFAAWTEARTGRAAPSAGHLPRVVQRGHPSGQPKDRPGVPGAGGEAVPQPGRRHHLDPGVSTAGHSGSAVGLQAHRLRSLQSPHRLCGSCRGDAALGPLGTAAFGVFKSTDGGMSWAPANDSQIKDLSINNLAVHPQNPSVAYAATFSGGAVQDHQRRDDVESS